MRLTSELKFAVRMLWKNPGMSLVAIVVVALAIGSNTTVFTFVNAVLLRGLPFEEPEQILHLESANLPADIEAMRISYPDLEDWQKQTTAFRGLAGFYEGTMNVSDQTRPPERYTGSWLGSNAFGLIGQQPLLGRDFASAEDQVGASDVVILGYSVWQNRYGGDSAVLGQTVRINEVPHVIIGVMPEGMRFPLSAELWVPLKKVDNWQDRSNRGLGVFGRLAEGQSVETARVELNAIAARLAEEYPDTNKDVSVVVRTFNERYNGGEIRLVFQALMGTVGFVLLIACANVANLLLARSLSRSREMSIRSAVGASRWHIVRQLLMESILLSMLGGVAGILLAYWGVGMFEQAVAGIDKPYWIDFRIDTSVLLFFLGICFVTGILFGLAPAWQTSRADLNAVLQERGRGNSFGLAGQRFSGVLVVGQIAMALILLVGAGLMIRSLLKTYDLELGIETEQLLTLRLSLPEAKYPEDQQRIVFHESLHERLRTVPGISAVTVTSNVPAGGSMWGVFRVEDRETPEDDLPSARRLVVGQDYFETVGARLLSGRIFNSQDGAPGREAVIVSREFADRHFPNESVLGRRMRFGEESESPWNTIVGVVSGVRQNGPSQEAIEPVIFRPYRSDPLRFMSILARTDGNPKTFVEGIRGEVQKVDPDLPVYDIRTLDEVMENQRWPFKVFGSLFAIFALAAMLMSAVGIYGVISYSVQRRTSELGVRTALGATRSRIVLTVMKRGMWQLGVGLILGLAGAAGISRVLASLLVQVSTTDLVTFAGVGFLLTTVTLLACLLPALRASRLDPLQALRNE